MSLPKIIMQTWKSNEIPPHWQVSPISIQKFMPDYEYRLMTDHDNRMFVSLHFPHFLKTFDAFPHNIQRADSIRYLWLYMYGGIYMDLDYKVLKPMDNLFDDSTLYFVRSKNVSSYITNSFMASKAGCPFWLQVIKEMEKSSKQTFLGKHLTVMNTTGPIMLTRVLKRCKTKYKLLPTNEIIPCSLCDLPCKINTKNIPYCQTLPGSSWLGFDSKCYNFILCNYNYILLLVFLLLLLLLYKYI